MVKNDTRTMFDLIKEFQRTENQYYYNGHETVNKQYGERAILKAPDAIGGGIIDGNTHGAALETVLNLMTIYASDHFRKPQKEYYIETDEFSAPKSSGFTLNAKDILSYVTFLTKYRRKDGNDTQMTTSGDFLIQSLGFAKVGVTCDNLPNNKEKYITTVARNLQELDRYWQYGYIPNIVPSYGFELGEDLIPKFVNNDMKIEEFVKTLQGTKLSERVRNQVLDTYLKQNPIDFSEFKNHQDFYKLRSKLNLPTKQSDLLAHEYEKTTNKKLRWYDRMLSGGVKQQDDSEKT